MSTVNKDAAALSALLRPFATVALVGLAPGVGKTTVLAELVKAHHVLHGATPLAVTSIGQGKNPGVSGVYLYAGMYAATAEVTLKDCDFTLRVCHTTGVYTPFGEVVVVQALSDGNARIAGPSINSQLSDVISYMRAIIGVRQVFVDGAGNKKTFAAELPDTATVLCTGASVDANFRRVIKETAHACRLLTLPCVDTAQAEDAYIIRGALTERLFGQTLADASKQDAVVVVEDASKIFLKSDTLEKFVYAGGVLAVENPACLAAVAINPIDPARGRAFPEDSFLDGLRECLTVPVYNVRR